MNQILSRLLQLQNQRARWLFITKQQLSLSEFSAIVNRYLIKDRQLVIEQQLLFQSLSFFRNLRDQEQCIFKKWTIRVLSLLEVPNFLMGKLQMCSNLMDVYAEIWKFWGQFGFAVKMQWIKIKIKTNQVSVYKMLAQKLIQTLRKKILNKIKSYKHFCKSSLLAIDDYPIQIMGGKIASQNISIEISTIVLKQPFRSSPVPKSQKQTRSKSLLSNINSMTRSMTRSINLEKSLKETMVLLPEKEKPRSVFLKRRTKQSCKRGMLRILYEPLNLQIQESYPFKAKQQQTIKNLLSRNNLSSVASSILHKLNIGRRTSTLGQFINKQPWISKKGMKDNCLNFNRITF